MEAIILNNFAWHTYAGLDSYGFTIEQETGKMIPQLREHDGMGVMFDAEKAGKSEEETDRLVAECDKKYRKAWIDDKMMNAIKDMANKGWTKV